MKVSVKVCDNLAQPYRGQCDPVTVAGAASFKVHDITPLNASGSTCFLKLLKVLFKDILNFGFFLLAFITGCLYDLDRKEFQTVIVCIKISNLYVRTD